MMTGKGIPIDWTNGAGTVGAGGTLTITADAYRQAIFIQNQAATAVSVILPAVKGSDGTSTTATLALSGTVNESQGGSVEFGLEGVMCTGQFTVVGTANAAVCVLTT